MNKIYSEAVVFGIFFQRLVATGSLIKPQCEYDIHLVSIPVMNKWQHYLHDGNPKNLHGHLNRNTKKETKCAPSPATCVSPWTVKGCLWTTRAAEAELVTFP